MAIGYGREPGEFRVEVVRSAAGEAAESDVSLDASGLLAARPQFEQTVLASAVAARQVPTSAERVVRETGQALFSALLGMGEVAGRYRASAALADSQGEALRIVLRIDAPELAGLPWEAMYDSRTGEYVCRHHQLVRHVPVAAVPPPLGVRTPLRVLGVISAPHGLVPLDTGREREQLVRALAGPAGQNLTEVAWAPPTWAGLHEMLLAGPWHVLHFIGHGDFDQDRDEGILALTGEDGRADLVEANRFADLLRQARPMPRLVMLNSCSGAHTGPSDLFSGTAAALARSGVAAVAAMQFAISDSAAVAFARGFYTALSHGRGVDESVSAGRIAILGTSGRTLEWITPVLYLRGDDTRLFALTPNRAMQPAHELPAAFAPALRPKPSTLKPVLRGRPPSLVPSRVVRILTGHTDSVVWVTFSPDGTRMATASRDDTARIWDAVTGALVRTLTGHTHFVTGVAFSPDSTLLATASYDKTVRIWDAATGAVARTLTGHTDIVWGVTFSPDGTHLATASSDKTAKIWDTDTGTLTRTLTGHTDTVTGVTFSPDGTHLATASSDKTAKIWDTVANSPTRTLTLTGNAAGVAFSPDGIHLATTSSDKTAKIWDSTTGTLTRTLTSTLNGHMRGVTFSPDGTLLAVAGDDKTVQIWS